MARRRILATLALASAGGAVAWALTGLPGAAAPCPADGCDCERPVAGAPRQPANAWSSLALAAAGVVLLCTSPTGATRAQPGAGSRGSGRRRAGTTTALALTLSGTAAFLYHSSLTAWTARLDGVAAAVLAAALALDTAWAGATAPRAGRRSLLQRLLAPALLLGLGGLCWALGRSGGPWCRPDSALQAHAAWHLLAAAGLFWWLRGTGRTAGFPHSAVRPLASRREDCPP